MPTIGSSEDIARSVRVYPRHAAGILSPTDHNILWFRARSLRERCNSGDSAILSRNLVDLMIGAQIGGGGYGSPGHGSTSLIAATALVHGMTVATRNVDDFAVTGVPIINPWKADAK